MLGHWGTTAAERARRLPCDDLVPDGQLITRAVSTSAPPEHVYRWLCQLRAGPYSYDLIDNLGRRSPRELTPGLDELELGQRVANVFRLVAFTPGEHLTMRATGRAFGDCAITYAAPPGRIVMRMRVAHPGPELERRARAAALPGLDLVMARRQLRNLATFAQRTTR